MTATITDTARPSQPDWTQLERLARSHARRLAQPDDRQDLVQEALLRYFMSYIEGRSPEHPNAWLAQTIGRLAIDLHRKRQGRDNPGSRPREVTHDVEELERVMRRQADSPSMLHIRHALVGRILGHLRGNERRVFVARTGGHTAREVAARLGLTPAAVDQAFARAKKTLRQALDADPVLLHDLRDELARIARHHAP